MTTPQSLKEEVRDLIIQAVNLRHLPKEQVALDSVLVGSEGLGLDSIDILEVVIAVERKYGVRIANGEQGITHFRSISTIADFIEQTRHA